MSTPFKKNNLIVKEDHISVALLSNALAQVEDVLGKSNLTIEKLEEQLKAVREQRIALNAQRAMLQELITKLKQFITAEEAAKKDEPTTENRSEDVNSGQSTPVDQGADPDQA